MLTKTYHKSERSFRRRGSHRKRLRNAALGLDAKQRPLVASAVLLIVGSPCTLAHVQTFGALVDDLIRDIGAGAS